MLLERSIERLLGQLLRNVGVSRASLEQHVFEQMGHARFAGTLIPGSDKVGDIHRRIRLRCIGKDEQLEPVCEFVFGNSLHRSNLRYTVGEGMLREWRERAEKLQLHGELEELQGKRSQPQAAAPLPPRAASKANPAQMVSEISSSNSGGCWARARSSNTPPALNSPCLQRVMTRLARAKRS
jgi:hypothetical protein